MNERGRTTILSLWVWLAVCAVGAASQAAASPHYLGPTGLTGDTSAKEIVITKVDKGSPAEGKIAPKAVIIGAGGKRFASDARREIADAIDQAETQEAGGVLTLMLKGEGKATRTVDLQLKVLGSYGENAPYDSPKVDAIVTRAADYLVRTGKYKDGELMNGWLGLMATGEAKYIDVVKRELPKQDWVHPDAKKIDEVLAGTADMGYVGWYWGYRLITLSEYYLLTGDKSVLPGIGIYANALARGQGPEGRWGHRMATPRWDNRVPGYGPMNQPSLVDFMGLLMARKCGIDDPVVDKAIERSHTAYGRYIGEGALPYGNHDPNTHTFNNNGTGATAAICMALYGNQAGEAFFSRQDAASYDGMETGHATYYFNIMWTPLGTGLCGPEVTKQFFEKTRWLQTLYRAWDGRFTFDGGNQKSGNDTGAHLLAYCLPRHALIITGRDADQSLWLDKDQATQLMQISRIDYTAMTPDQLIGLFDHWAPQVVLRAVWTLREKQGDFTPKLVELMKSGTKTQKIAAIGYFGYKCPQEIALPQLDTLGAIMLDKQRDPAVRAAAASSISHLGQPAYKYFDDMLRFVLEDKPNDPLRNIDDQLAQTLVTLCDDPFAAGLITDPNRKLFYTAVMSLADHKRQDVRAQAMRLLQGMPLADFPVVADKVKYVVLNRDPTYTSYHNPGSAVAAGAIVLANLHIEDGMQWARDMLDTPDGKGSFKIMAFLHILNAYGPNAGPMVEKVKANPKLLDSLANGRWSRLWEPIVKTTQDPSKPPTKLITFEQAKQAQ